MSITVKPDLHTLVEQFGAIHKLRSEADSWENELEGVLSPYIAVYERVVPVPCGFMGGWCFDGVEGSVVRLKHECFWAHNYDLHHEYHVDVNLEALLSLTPKEQPII